MKKKAINENTDILKKLKSTESELEIAKEMMRSVKVQLRSKDTDI